MGILAVLLNVFTVITELFQLCVLPLIKSIYYFFAYGKEYAVDYRRRNFANCMTLFTPICNAKTVAQKTVLFSELAKDAANRKLRVLEIGIGSGSNLDFYPPNVTLLALDPNEHFVKHLNASLEKHPHVNFEKLHIGYGEDMKDIESESVDAVVTCYVNCSVQNLDKVLKEIGRVLKPGGKYYFLEHVYDHDKGCARYWIQKFLSLTRIWPFFFDGCSFVDSGSAISESPYFSNVSLNKFYIDPSGSWVFVCVSPNIYGTATK